MTKACLKLEQRLKKKSGTVKSGDLAGQRKSTKRRSSRISVVARAVCAVAPSYGVTCPPVPNKKKIVDHGPLALAAFSKKNCPRTPPA